MSFSFLNKEDISVLPVMEQFYTVQGEGFHSGRAAYFIRLGGCDVGCVWCDVKESWNAGDHPVTSVRSLVMNAENSGTDYVVITGGEPTMYELSELTSQLQGTGIETGIETSGVYPLSGTWNWICLSPKKFKPVLPENYKKANELKVIVYNKHDLDWAIEQSKNCDLSCKKYLQPEWSREKEMLPLIIDFVKANPDWRISLQTHKYMDIP